MSGGLIALVLASITGLLAVWLWLSQTSQVNTVADVARAEQRCERARFDQRFDSTLSASNPQSQSDAQRVARICGEAEQARAAQRAAAASQAAQMKQLQQSLTNSLSPSASQPKEQK